MDPEPEIPVADLAADTGTTAESDAAAVAQPPSRSPTQRDRWVRWGVLLGGFLGGGGGAFLVLDRLADRLQPHGAFDAVLHGSAVQGSAFAASFVGVACAIAAWHLYLVQRFPDRRERILFRGSVRGVGSRVRSPALTPEVVAALNQWAKQRAERRAEQSASYDNALVTIGVIALLLMAAYCWVVWAGMFVAIGGGEVSWRGFSLVRHVEPMDAVIAIYPTARFVRDGESRPCLVVQFADGQFINTQELRIMAAQRDGAAAALARGSGVTPRQAPWLDLVPAPK